MTEQTKDGILASIVAVVVVFASFAYIMDKPIHGQAISGTPATILAGSGSPVTNGLNCGIGQASATSTALYDDTSVASANSLWKCKLGTDGVTFGWAAPFSTPILATSGTVGGALMVLNSTATSTVTVAGAYAGEVCELTPASATPLPAGVLKDCYVTGTGANNVTIRLTALIAATPAATTFNVRLIP